MNINNIVPKPLMTSCEDTLHEQLSKIRLKIKGFRIDLYNQNVAPDALRSELEASTCKLTAVDGLHREVAALNKLQKQQTKKAKQLWVQKCWPIKQLLKKRVMLRLPC